MTPNPTAQRRYINFRQVPEGTDPKRAAKTVLAKWHKNLDPGERAEFRRCRRSGDCLLLQGYTRLLRRLGNDYSTAHNFRLARVAALVSTVKEHKPAGQYHGVAYQLAEPNGNQPMYSLIRMRRLLSETEPERVFDMLRTAVRHLGFQCDLFDLANSMWWWNDRTRRQWALDYYGRLPLD